MDDLFDEPGDLGFFDIVDEGIKADMELDNLFYEPAPGEVMDEDGGGY